MADSKQTQLVEQAYQRLRQLARGRMREESPDNTLQATALVHESWLRLGRDLEDGYFKDSKHFIGVAAETMRRVLIDHARAKKSRKRGGEWKRTTTSKIDSAQLEATTPGLDHEMFGVHEALDHLGIEHPRKAELTKLRYFGGLSIPEAAAVLEISVPTANRDWNFARAWLRREMES